MLRKTMMTISLVVSVFNLAQAQDVDFVNLRVRVEGISHDKGEIGVALFSSPKGYPTHIEHAYEAQWVGVQEGPNAIDVVFEGVPFGDYAVSVLHDENGNRKLERSTLGFPKEGVGFSNDQKVILSAPSFNASKLTLSKAEDLQIVITLDYRE
jgi:uncharacterized protein (DUF2141 family)